MAAHLKAVAPACPPDTLVRAETALEELLTNSIVHGHAAQMPAAMVWLAAAYEGDVLRLRYEDALAAFDPIARIDEALLRTANPLEQRPMGGLGLLMVFRLADGFGYRHERGRNRIDLRFSSRAVASPGMAQAGSVDLGA